MKKILSVTLAILIGVSLAAQKPANRGHEHKSPDITQLVSNLTEAQKSKLDAITAESRQRVEKLRAQQKTVRDSIAVYMEREGDQSKILNSLFDRSAKIQSQISREMYNTKVRIDEVLTPAQRQEYQKASKQQHKKHDKKPKGEKPSKK